MGFNPFLPIAGAKINVLCIPAGPMRPDRFQKFIKTLQNASGIGREAVDATPASGHLFYDVSATQDKWRSQLFPFETNSKCQVLLGLIDGERLVNSSAKSLLADGTPSTNVLDTIEAIRTRFEEQHVAEPGLVVRRLICCGIESSIALGQDVLGMPEVDGTNAAREVLISLSRQLIAGLTSVINGLKDQPISMVPGANALTLRRMGTNPVPTSGSSTPVSTKPSSPMPVTNRPEQQSDTSRGRYSIVQGIFRVQCGSWTAALGSLAEGASIAQGGHDHLWHAKALEYLLLCMMLLAWSDMTFAVPQVCRSLPNRSGTFPAEARSGESMKVLAQLLPPMVETILELYTKVSNLDLGGSLQDVLRESRVRLVNVLIFVKRAGGVLTRQGLNEIVELNDDELHKTLHADGEPVAISKAGLANILIETLQEAQSSRSMLHPTCLLVAVASSLSMLGLDRKHAFYIKQLMQQFVPKLIEARKLGASEAGIHPSAGLPPLSVALQGVVPDMVVGTRKMLSLAAGAYGVPLPPVPQPQKRRSADLDSIYDRLRTWTIEHDSGDALLKLEMLRTCVSVCEALPDVPAGLYFSSNILRGAKRSVTASRLVSDSGPLISADEQARLFDSMKRGVSAASRLGADGCRAEYWDDFLVRDIQVYEQDTFAKLIAHKPGDLAIRGSALVDTVRDPFIYNPFSKDKSVTAAPVLVAGELSTFAVLLQNPLDIEIEIVEICLLSKGCAFAASTHSIVLGPLSTQMFTLNGTPTVSGDLEIIGCTATIRSCYEQDFLTFHDDWKAPVILKHRSVNKTGFKTAQRPNSENEAAAQGVETNFKPPVTTPLKLTVISTQPRLSAQSRSLQSSSIMLLEGESRVFDLNLVNESQIVPADLVLVTVEDSVRDRLTDALVNQDLNPAEKYEFQNQLALHPAVEIKNKGHNDAKKVLSPGTSIDYAVAVFGRPGLVSATVQADFAFLGMPSVEVKGTFYTRQVRFPISITVNGSVEMPRCNILPIHGDFTWSSDDATDQQPKRNGTSQAGTSDITKLSTWLKSRPDASQYCMLSLDIRNVWPHPLSIELQARRPDHEVAGEDVWKDAYSVSETLQPGHVSRVVLLVPRIFISDPHAAIPNLETKKQFVVTTSKLSTEAETASRESFWYREELLKCVRGTWREESSGRHGEIDLRKGIRLSPRMVDALKVEHVEMDYMVRPHEKMEEEVNSPIVKQIGRSHFVVQTESFATLFVTIRNHTQEALRLILRLQPALRHQPHNIALDLSKRFAWTGVLQRAVHPAVEPGGVFIAQLGIIPLVDGEYEVNASVEEIAGRRTPSNSKSPDPADAGSGRRIWHARSPCLIDATG